MEAAIWSFTVLTILVWATIIVAVIYMGKMARAIVLAVRDLSHQLEHTDRGVKNQVKLLTDIRDRLKGTEERATTRTVPLVSDDGDEHGPHV